MNKKKKRIIAAVVCLLVAVPVTWMTSGIEVCYGYPDTPCTVIYVLGVPIYALDGVGRRIPLKDERLKEYYLWQ